MGMVFQRREVAIQDGTFNFKYSGSKNIDEVAWYGDNSGNQTHNVGMKKTNQLGLYDCSGNVWEWCYDGVVYDESKLNRRIRGGAWNYSSDFCDILCRNYVQATFNINYIGFRIVRTI